MFAYLLRFMYPEPGEGGGGEPGGEPGGGAGGAGGGGGSGGGGGAGAGGEGGKATTPTPVTFASQADVDALVQGRVARAEASALEKVAKAAGFDNVEAMQAAAKAGKATEDANKTELQKATDAATAATAAAATAGEQLKAERISNAFIIEATKANIPADRLADALALTDRSGITLADDGKVSGVSEAVKTLIADKPWLVAAAGAGTGGANGAGANGGARNSGTQPVPLEEGKRRMAELMGVDPDRVAQADLAKPNTPQHADYVMARMKEVSDAAKGK